jgi:hypothetical protein
MVRFETARTEGIAAQDIADFLAILHPFDGGSEPKGRAGPARHTGFFSQAEDLDNMAEITGHGLVDEEQLLGGEHRPGLLQVGPAVHALDHHAVHLLAQLLDGEDDLHAQLIFHLGRVPLDAADRGFHVGRAAGIAGYNLTAGLGFRSVDQLGEFRDV